MKQQTDQAKVLPELNLYNFEEDEFAGSKYVLTSPRSLEACDMLGVKPLQLIYKPLADFQDEMRQQGLTFQEAYTEYDHYEKERQAKLRECRDYRDKMIRDNVFKPSEEVQPTFERGEPMRAEEYLGVHDVRARDEPHSIKLFANSRLKNTSVFSSGLRTNRSNTNNGYQIDQSLCSHDRLDNANGHSNGLSGDSTLIQRSDQHSWRRHPPYSERHLSKHSKTSAVSHPSASDVPLQPAGGYKSRFMREKLGLIPQPVAAGQGDTQFTSSLPSHSDDAYRAAYTAHRRSYTTDGVGAGLNRTSTPYEGTMAKTKTADRSFGTISDINSANSPRDEVEYGADLARRRRTTSAYANLERETSTLRNLVSRYEPGTDVNMSRSLSLTDLNQPVLIPRQSYSTRRAGRHNRGYTSDDEYTSAHRLRAKEAVRAEDILSRALERRQQEIEADMREEEREYRGQVHTLRNDLREMRVADTRFNSELGVLDQDWESRKWRPRHDRDREIPIKHLSNGVTDYSNSFYRSSNGQVGHDVSSLYRPRHATAYSTCHDDETLADKTKRERRVELARLQAVEELEAARVLSQKSRLQSERVRKAFREALSKNVQKWNHKETERYQSNRKEDEEDDDSYQHIEEVLSRSLSSGNSSGNERAYPRPTRPSAIEPPHARVSNGHEERELDRLRNSLRRDETYLSEEAVRKHTLLSSLSPRDSDDLADLEAALEETEERLSSLQNTPREERKAEPVANGGKRDKSDERAKRVKNGTTSDSKKGRARLKHSNQELVEERVREMRASLEERRKKLMHKLKVTDRQTDELRAARLESERRDRERRQERANRRILKNSADNSKKKQNKSTSGNHSTPVQRHVQQMKPVRTSAVVTPSRGRDTFDKKVLKAELNNWVNTGHRSQRSRSRSANRNHSQFTLT
ncbi:apical junction molecule-like [Watersipora subatra]|uniref:apical junction molecule-like n=1 Tax=Watersipora subatra TaxID=2589382 RepID=UPI00355C5D44